MTEDELLQYIFKAKDKNQHFVLEFTHWIKSSERFKAFAETYRDKIRKKVKEAKDNEALRDVRFELEMAHLILRNGHFLKVEYEKFGTGERQAPDFTVTCVNGTTFNLEVKRIRTAISEIRLEKWKKDIKKQISAIPSTTLALSIEIDIGEFNPSSDLLDRLEGKISAIIDYIVNTVPAAEIDIPVDGTKRYPVPGFEEDEIKLVFRKPPNKLTHTLDWYGGAFPIFNTRREYRKFWDKILDNLGQMLPGMTNILVITTDSITHGYFDFGAAITSLANLVAQGYDDFFKRRKNFAGVDDFIKQTERLSGILFRSDWVYLPSYEYSDDRNILWCNEGADYVIPDDIKEILQRLN